MTQELSERQKALYESEWANFVQRHKDGGDPWISADAAIFIDSKLASPSASPSSAADGGAESDMGQDRNVPDCPRETCEGNPCPCVARPAAAPVQDADRERFERRIVRKGHCIAVFEGNENVASFVGPDAEVNAQEFAEHFTPPAVSQRRSNSYPTMPLYAPSQASAAPEAAREQATAKTVRWPNGALDLMWADHDHDPDYDAIRGGAPTITELVPRASLAASPAPKAVVPVARDEWKLYTNWQNSVVNDTFTHFDVWMARANLATPDAAIAGPSEQQESVHAAHPGTGGDAKGEQS
jgi:hypothetical protein